MATTWQEYVDQHLVGTGLVRAAVVFGVDGTLWATSQGWNLSQDEAAQILQCFNDPASGEAGVVACGQRFQLIRCEDDMLLAKRAHQGICAYRTNQCVVLGFYDENVNGNPGQCNAIISRLGQYFREVGY
eukprot:tig00021434_g21317.t1